MTGSGIVSLSFFALVLIFLFRSEPSLEVPKSLGSEATIPDKELFQKWTKAVSNQEQEINLRFFFGLSWIEVISILF